MPQPGEPASLGTFRDGNLHFDFVERLVIYDVRPASLRNRVELTRDEAAVRGADRASPRTTILGAPTERPCLGSTDDDAAKKTMKVIARLQFKLGQTDLPRCPVEMAPGVGCWYRMLNP